MATGGHPNEGKELRQKLDSTSNGNNLGDRPASLPWPSLPNNLELNSKSKHTKKKRNKEKESDHASTTAAKRNIKVPVNQRSQSFQRASSKSSMENENTTQSKEEYNKYKNATAIRDRLTHLQDCIAQVNSVLQHLKQSDEPAYKAEVPRLEEMRNMLSQDELLHKELLCRQILNEADISNDEADESDSESSPFIPKPSDANQARETGGRQQYFTEEDKANIQNHLLEKMKTSQEKLTALKQQQTLLLTMRRNAEEKLAAFQAEIAKNGLEGPSTQDWQYPTESSSAEAEDALPNGDSSWKQGYNRAPHGSSLSVQNTQKVVKNGPKNFLSGTGDGNTQEITTLHANLEHIKRRLEVLQEYSDDRNEDQLSPGELEIDQNLSNRLLAVEWQRKKLKNRLLELQEKKKASDELMKELSLIKEAANAVENLNGGEDSGFSLANVQEPPQPSLYDANEGGALEAVRETISQLRGMLSTSVLAQESHTPDAATASFPASSTQDTLVKQNSYRASPGKRDNIKKGQNDQFPARRHYEAEGRANEDPDVPTAPIAALSTPDTDSWSKGQRKGQKRRAPREKQQLIQAMLDSLKGKGGRLPNSVLQAITLFDDEEASSENDAETATDNEDSQENDDSSSVAEGKTLDIVPIKIKDEPREVSDSMRQPENEDRAEASANIDELHNLEKLKEDRDELHKIQEKFTRLRHKFSSLKPNNEEHRSRGEGGSLQKKKSRSAHEVSVSNPLPSQQQHRQDNLLTRQNVATVESQNRNNSSNLARGNNPSLKKDNINDLSAKYKQSAGPSSIRGNTELLCKYRTEMKSQDLHESHHKSQFVDIMKQDRNKLQNFSRNRDVQVHSNSSINSEPLDGSSSALAPDTTVAATWGGSSTQENFEDENEPFESLEEQEEEESNNEDAMMLSNRADVSMNDNILVGDPILTSVPKSYAAQYSNYSGDSSSKRRDNRLHKYFKSTQLLNHWNSKKNFSRPGGQRVHSSDAPREFSGLDDMQAQAEDTSQTSVGSLNSTNPIPMQDKFMQRLHLHLEKLNALCRPVLQEPIPSSNMACQTVPSQPGRDGSILPNLQYPLHNPSIGRSPQAVPDLMQGYTQQLQLQQQLLLSLSHCYHALYMQQLEIHHLQRCLSQGADSEVSAQQPNLHAPSTEEFALRPWYLNPWFGSTVPFPPCQVSPMSAPPFMQQSQPAFAFSPNIQAPNTGTASAQRALVTSIQPARAVVHPAAQDTRVNSETLNNQVPPRTRANNYLDNFRSYSRQNLLSSANGVKGKESSTTPQVRQVHPLIPNESSWAHRSRVFIPPHTENMNTTTTAPTTTTQSSDTRSLVRPVTNTEFQGTSVKVKKPNLSRQQGSLTMPDSSTTVAAAAFNSFVEPDQTCRPHADDNPSAERCAAKAKPSTSASTILSSTTQPLPDNIHAEVSRFLAQNSNQEGILEEFFRELRNVKADSLPRVLGAVRNVANSERPLFLSSTVRHLESDSHVQDRVEFCQTAENPLEGASSSTSTNSASDLSSFKLACESACQRSNQNWPPATIIPLGKHIPKPSTGAVKKRPASSRESSACSAAGPLVYSTMLESQSSEQNKVPVHSESLESTVERVILELIPFVQCHSTDDCCTSLRANFAVKVIEALKNNCALKFSPEFLAQVRQTVMQVCSKYANTKWLECESELLKTVASALFQEVSLYKSMSARLSLEESADHSVKNPQPDVLPSSSKSFAEAHKQIIPNKDHRDMSLEVDSGPFSVQEFENNVGDLYVNMPTQETGLVAHCNGNVQHEPMRGAIGGSCSPPVSSWQNHVVSAEEDTCYECDPEAEGEPEVEACTEADLAEADQSPAPQGMANGMPMADGFHIAQPCLSHLSHIISVNSDENICAEASASADGVLNLSLPSQGACNSNPEKEITLDDVPIKLAPMSQEELQRQMAEEQSSNLLLVAHQLDGSEDLPLAGSGDALKDPPTFI